MTAAVVPLVIKIRDNKTLVIVSNVKPDAVLSILVLVSPLVCKLTFSCNYTCTKFKSPIRVNVAKLSARADELKTNTRYVR